MAVALWIIESRSTSDLVQLVRILAFKRIKNQIWRRRPRRVMDCFSLRLQTRKNVIFHFFMHFPCIMCLFSMIWYILQFRPITWPSELLRRWLWRRLKDETLTIPTTPKSAKEASIAPSYGCFRQSIFQKNDDLRSILVSKCAFKAINFVNTQSFTR